MARVNIPTFLRILSVCLSAGLALLVADSSTPDRIAVAISALLAFSGVVVAVFGVWVAVLFPGIVAGLASGVVKESVPGYQSFGYLIKALYRSAFVLSALVFVTLTVSLSTVQTHEFSLAQSFFFFLCFAALVDCFAQTIGWGERSVVEGLNAGHVEGSANRIFRGRRSARNDVGGGR